MCIPVYARIFHLHANRGQCTGFRQTGNIKVKRIGVCRIYIPDGNFNGTRNRIAQSQRLVNRAGKVVHVGNDGAEDVISPRIKGGDIQAKVSKGWNSYGAARREQRLGDAALVNNRIAHRCFTVSIIQLTHNG